MSIIRIEDIAHVRFAAPDLQQMQDFLSDFGLASQFADDGRLYARAADGLPYHHVTEQGDPAFKGLGLRAENIDDLELLAAAEGVLVENLNEPGGGKVVRLKDPDGVEVEVVTGQTRLQPTALTPDPLRNTTMSRSRERSSVRLQAGPSHVKRLGHCVLNVSDFRRSERWYKERFGFITSDEIEAKAGVALGAFMRCDRGDVLTDHHTLFLAQLPQKPGFMHAAFEVANMDDLMLGHDHLQNSNRSASWGVGRHILGSQIFDYWLDPWGHELEHWTDGDLFTAADGSNKSPFTDLLADKTSVQWPLKARGSVLMANRTTNDCDVLICGAGPTGVTLGILLARQGVSVIIVEKEADIYPLPRAAHLDHEAIRILQAAGVAELVMATCRQANRYDFLNAAGDVLLRFESESRLAPGGWPPSNFIHQPSIEAILRRELADTPGVVIRPRWEMVEARNSGSRVTATCQSPDGPQNMTARYVVGADGARSPLRESLGIEFEDLNFDEPWLVVDAVVQDFARLPKINLQICNPERPTTCVLMGEGRHRWEFMIKPGETSEQVSDDGFIEKLLEPWGVKGAISIERKAVYRFNARVAKAWRKGRFLLAGDAAHQTPPFAGQGMCAGLRDVDNLSWKLASVIHGNVDADILDTYQEERSPHVRTSINLAMMMGQTVCITDPAAAALRDKQMIAARAAGTSQDGTVPAPLFSTGLILSGAPGAGGYFPQPYNVENPSEKLDDVLGRGPWLVSREKIDASLDTNGLRVAVLSDPDLAPYAAVLETWLSEHDSNAVLVRPDHYVYGAGDARALVEAFQQVIRPASASAKR
ncbi:tsdB [Symbiodinium pilosum]|uniref:TsdB protein n=1 Tax=Symbiodinium pilosum TaxID=2952 RepID=A0A812V0A5_SYMPI|nr:tsdB [Symbiodinium pilosum]